MLQTDTTHQSMQEAEIIRWNNRHAILMLGLCLVVWSTGGVSWLVTGAGLSIMHYLWSGRQDINALRFHIGRANALTVFRLFLVTVVLACYTAEQSVLFAVILVAGLCLDGVDGYLARKYNESSKFGSYLDMEADAYAICGITILLWKYHDVGSVVLLAGILRYIYALLIRLTVKTQRLEPKRRYASTIAVCFYLSGAACLVLTNDFTISLVYFLTVLLIVSFVRSYWFQLKGW